jgi:hypothetical protein
MGELARAIRQLDLELLTHVSLLTARQAPPDG